jgi:hypothetical protein
LSCIFNHADLVNTSPRFAAIRSRSATRWWRMPDRQAQWRHNWIDGAWMGGRWNCFSAWFGQNHFISLSLAQDNEIQIRTKSFVFNKLAATSLSFAGQIRSFSPPTDRPQCRDQPTPPHQTPSIYSLLKQEHLTHIHHGLEADLTAIGSASP